MTAPARSRGGITQDRIAEGIGGLNSAAAFPVSQGVHPVNWTALALGAEQPRDPGGTPLSSERAAQLVADIRASVRTSNRQAFEMVCRRAFEGAAPAALGFNTWPAFVESLRLDEIANTPTPPLRAHPAADLFPLISGAELEALIEDVREHGQREPIVIMRDGSVLDGRNRMRACQQLGLEPVTRVYDGDDPVAFVASLNLKRRHLDTSQRAMIAASLATMRQGARTDLPQICGKSQTEAAELLNVSTRTVTAATKVRAEGSPELIAAVERGEVSVSAAAGQLGPPRADKPAGSTTSKGSRLTDRTPEAGSRISPTPSVTTTHAAAEPQTLAEAVRRVAAAVREGTPHADIADAVSVALKIHNGRNSLPGSAVLAELVGELLDVVRALAKGAA